MERIGRKRWVFCFSFFQVVNGTQYFFEANTSLHNALLTSRLWWNVEHLESSFSFVLFFFYSITPESPPEHVSSIRYDRVWRQTGAAWPIAGESGSTTAGWTFASPTVTLSSPTPTFRARVQSSRPRHSPVVLPMPSSSGDRLGPRHSLGSVQ